MGIRTYGKKKSSFQKFLHEFNKEAQSAFNLFFVRNNLEKPKIKTSNPAIPNTTFLQPNPPWGKPKKNMRIVAISMRAPKENIIRPNFLFAILRTNPSQI